MSQESLIFGAAYELARADRLVLGALNDAVDVVGLNAAAGVCDCRKTDLHDALSGRDNRYVRGSWERAIASIAPDDLKLRIATAMLIPVRMVPAAPRPLTDKERADLLEMKLRSLGQLGEQIISDAIGGRR
jgi:hypothetical protein